MSGGKGGRRMRENPFENIELLLEVNSPVLQVLKKLLMYRGEKVFASQVTGTNPVRRRALNKLMFLGVVDAEIGERGRYYVKLNEDHEMLKKLFEFNEYCGKLVAELRKYPFSSDTRLHIRVSRR